MSRQIDQDRMDSGDLDEDEIRYLQDRGMLPEGVDRIEDNLDQPRPVGEEANTGDANTAGLSVEQLDARVQQMAEDQQDVPTIEDEGGIDDEDMDYDAMNNDDRRAELHTRGLSTSGTKDELIARLRRSDAGTTTDADQA